jgi:hypothetical protein
MPDTPLRGVAPIVGYAALLRVVPFIAHLTRRASKEYQRRERI